MMPVARVQMPDGRIARLEVPDGTTPEQAQQYAQDIASMDVGVMQEYADKPAETGGTASRFARGFAHGIKQPFVGLGQRFGLVDEEDVARDRALNAPLLGTTAGRAGDIVGQALPAVGLSVATRNPRSLIGAVGKEAAIGAGQGFTTPTTGENEAPAMNTAYGAIGGGLAGGVAHGISRFITPFPGISKERRHLMTQAEKMDVPVSPAQVTESKALRAIEQAAGESTETHAKHARAFNQAAGKAIGLPDADSLSPEALRLAEVQNTALRGNLVANTVLDTQGSPEFQSRLRDMIMRYQLREGPARSNEQAEWIRMMADWYRRGGIPGDVYQANREVAGAAARQKGVNQHFFSEIVNLMDTARPPGLERQWQEVNRQYRNLTQLNRPGVIDEAGNVKPSALWSITQGQKGRGELAQLAAVGKAFPPIQEPSHQSFASTFSNPAARAIAGSTIGGGSSYYYGQREPGEVAQQTILGGLLGLAAPSMLQGIITSGPGRAYLTRGMLGGVNLAPALVPAAPFAASASIYSQNRE